MFVACGEGPASRGIATVVQAFNATTGAPSAATGAMCPARGAPASRVAVSLEVQNTDESWTELSHAWTDADGRVKPFFLVDRPVSVGTYRLVFDTELYFTSLSAGCFYPQVTVVFNVDDGSQHYHVPLLLSPYSYSTYRGS